MELDYPTLRWAAGVAPHKYVKLELSVELAEACLVFSTVGSEEPVGSNG